MAKTKKKYSKKIKRINTKKKYSKRKTRSRKNKSLKGGTNYTDRARQFIGDKNNPFYPFGIGMALGAGMGAATTGASIGAAVGLGNLVSQELYKKDKILKDAQEYRNRLIKEFPQYISEDGCESKEFRKATLSKWKSNTSLGNWKDLYKNNPIIVIFAHGGLTYGQEDDYYFNIPSETQLISFERSSNLGYSKNTFRYVPGYIGGYYEYSLVSDIINTSMNPNNEHLYFLEDDGITIKPSFLYQPVFHEEKFNEGEVSVACQKLYREDDTINNIGFYFNDPNGSFTYSSGTSSPDPTEKSKLPFQMTGIYVFNSSKPLEEFQSELKKKYEEYSEKIKISEDLNYNEKLYNLTLLIRLLYGSHNVKKLSSNNNKFNYKFNLNDGNTTLREVMDLFGKGTYYNVSCKSLSLFTPDDVKMVRQISERRERPPKLELTHDEMRIIRKATNRDWDLSRLTKDDNEILTRAQEKIALSNSFPK